MFLLWGLGGWGMGVVGFGCTKGTNFRSADNGLVPVRVIFHKSGLRLILILIRHPWGARTLSDRGRSGGSLLCRDSCNHACTFTCCAPGTTEDDATTRCAKRAANALRGRCALLRTCSNTVALGTVSLCGLGQFWSKLSRCSAPGRGIANRGHGLDRRKPCTTPFPHPSPS